MYTFTSNLNKKEYNEFVENYSMASFMQEYEWANVKNNWESFHCGLYKDKKLVAVCLILVKKVFKNIKLFYVPRGYLIDFTNFNHLKEMTLNIKELAKKSGAYAVKIDPNFCISDNSFKEEIVEHNYSKDYKLKHNNLIKLGYKHTGINKEISKNLQPQYNIFAPMCDSDSNILTSDDILKKYGRIKSYIGNYHEKRGISFEITNIGTVDGKETAQIYIGKDESSFERPKKELKDFAKTMIKSGETQKLYFKIPLSDIAVYDDKSVGWTVEPGKYQIYIGSSSQDIRLKDTVNV